MIKIAILDGPPASGKTTVVNRFSEQVDGVFTLSYKSLGLANFLSGVLLRLEPNLLAKKIYEKARDDPITLLDRAFSSKLSYIFSISEILYKTSQIFNILIALTIKSESRTGGIIIDEGLALRWANYENLKRQGILDLTITNLLMKCDMWLLGFMSRFRVLYCYFSPSRVSLEAFWKSRGHVTEYPSSFLALVYLAWKSVEQNVNALGSIKVRQFKEIPDSMSLLQEFFSANNSDAVQNTST